MQKKASEAPQLLNDIEHLHEHFDKQVLIEKLGLNMSFVYEILALGEEDLNINIKLIYNHLEYNQWNEIKLLVHKIKGTAVAIGFQRLRQLTVNFENNSLSSNPDLSQHLEAIAAEIHFLNEQIFNKLKQ
jgi:HPt (histidine-containing phosphotransfer) domain-containing protein